MKHIIIYLLLIIVCSCQQENQPPVCKITHPEENTVFELGDDITISVEATDSEGFIQEIRLYLDELNVTSKKESSFTFTFNTNDYYPGEFVIKAIAKDDEGLETSDELWVTINAISASVTTNVITSITETSAVCGGKINSDGGAPILAKGICWSSTQNPSISDSKTNDGQDSGSFTSMISELTSGTTYYVRAYASNSQGTGYGNEMSFRTTWDNSTTITDVDGNVYQTVAIEDQIWMAENLKTTRYADGTAIPLKESASGWDSIGFTDRAYCWYENDASNGETYGALYTWIAATDSTTSSNAIPSDVQGVCPDGWHLPSDGEWSILIDYLGGESVAGGKLKETGMTHWLNYNEGATNESGFTALPGGTRLNDGRFGKMGSGGYWWTSTEGDTYLAWYLFLGDRHAEVRKYNVFKNSSFSVRCVKDQ